ncbi:MAG: ABC transporter permease subunit [Terriglobales bacterium]
MRLIVLIALTTLQQAARRKLVGFGLLIAVAFLILYGLGWHLSVAGVTLQPFASRAAHVFFLQLGLYAADLLVAVVAILVASDALAADIASGAIHTLLSKPLARWQLLLGKWLGLVLLLTALEALLFGGVLGLSFAFAHLGAAHAAHALLLLWVEMVLLVSLTLLWSTRLPALASGVISLGLFGIAFLGGWIEQWGSFTVHAHAVLVGIVSSLILPTEALWHRASFEMQSPLMSLLSSSIGDPFTSQSVPSHLMIVYAAAYTLVALGLAILSFERLDL